MSGHGSGGLCRVRQLLGVTGCGRRGNARLLRFRRCPLEELPGLLEEPFSLRVRFLGEGRPPRSELALCRIPQGGRMPRDISCLGGPPGALGPVEHLGGRLARAAARFAA